MSNFSSAFAIFLLILCISFLLQTIQTQLAEKKIFFHGLPITCKTRLNDYTGYQNPGSLVMTLIGQLNIGYNNILESIFVP